MTTWAIVVAAGTGDRFGGPKQYESLRGRRVVDWSLGDAREACDGVVLVVTPARVADPADATVVVPGAASRSGSVRAGLAAVPDDAEIVVVHDAARPLAGVALFQRVVEAVAGGADAAICAVPITDTVKRVSASGVIEQTLDRAGLVAVQTPQGFRASVLRRAHEGRSDATDDAALVEALGGAVVVVAGHARNLKITAPGDLALAEALCEATAL